MDIHELERLIIEQRKQMIKFKDSQANPLLRSYSKLLDELEQELATLFVQLNTGGEWEWGKLQNSRRLNSIFIQLHDKIDEVGKVTEMNLNDSVEAAVRTDYAFTSFIAAQSLEGRVLIPATLPMGAIEEIMNHPWSGEHFSSRLWSNKDYLKRTLRQEIVQSMVLGEGFPKTTKRLTKKLETEAYKAERLVRSEIIAAGNRSAKVYYQNFDNEYSEYDILQAIRIVETLDRRTCQTCRDLDGTSYSVKEADKIKDIEHPNCRRVLVPSIRGFDQIGQRAARDLEGKYTRTTAKNYREYAEEQGIPYNYQRSQEEIRKRNAKDQHKRYKERLPDLPDLKVFASQKARNTELYKEWQQLYREVGKLSK